MYLRTTVIISNFWLEIVLLFRCVHHIKCRKFIDENTT